MLQYYYQRKEVINLFNIGDKIVYPSQGVGFIDVIEELEFQSTLQKHYKIHFVNSTMRLMLPSTRMDASNIRLVSEPSIIDHTLDNINDYNNLTEELNIKFCKDRIKVNTVKLHAGTLVDYVEVITNLTEINKTHKLNSSEKQMLTSAKKFLSEEISLTKNITNLEAMDLLDSSLGLV